MSLIGFFCEINPNKEVDFFNADLSKSGEDIGECIMVA